MRRGRTPRKKSGDECIIATFERSEVIAKIAATAIIIIEPFSLYIALNGAKTPPPLTVCAFRRYAPEPSRHTPTAPAVLGTSPRSTKDVSRRYTGVSARNGMVSESGDISSARV